MKIQKNAKKSICLKDAVELIEKISRDLKNGHYIEEKPNYGVWDSNKLKWEYYNFDTIEKIIDTLKDDFYFDYEIKEILQSECRERVPVTIVFVLFNEVYMKKIGKLSVDDFMDFRHLMIYTMNNVSTYIAINVLGYLDKKFDNYLYKRLETCEHTIELIEDLLRKVKDGENNRCKVWLQKLALLYSVEINSAQSNEDAIKYIETKKHFIYWMKELKVCTRFLKSLEGNKLKPIANNAHSVNNLTPAEKLSKTINRFMIMSKKAKDFPEFYDIVKKFNKNPEYTFADIIKNSEVEDMVIDGIEMATAEDIRGKLKLYGIHFSGTKRVKLALAKKLFAFNPTVKDVELFVASIYDEDDDIVSITDLLLMDASFPGLFEENATKEIESVDVNSINHVYNCFDSLVREDGYEHEVITRLRRLTIQRALQLNLGSQI